MTEPATEALFLRYRQAGDPQALAAVFDHLAPQLLLVAAHLVGGGVAEDLVQATFLDAIRHRERWDASRPLAPWLVGLLANHVREARRQRGRVPDPRRLAARDSERPDDVAEANECIAAVNAAVERLPLHYRQVLSLRLVHGLEQQQIGSSLGVPLGTVKVRLHRGMVLLRRALPAGFASGFAVLLSPGRGLAAVRQVVLGEAGVAVGAAAATAGVLIGGWMMKQVVLAVAVVLAAVGTWFAVDAALAAPATVAVASGASASPVAANVDASPPAPAPAVMPTAPIQEAPASRVAAPTTGGLAVQVSWASDGDPAADVEVFVYSSADQERAMKERTPLRGVARRTSDARGRLQFDALAPGDYFCRALEVETISPSNATVIAGAVAPCDVTLAGDVRLAFLVVDEQSVPSAGATVWCPDRAREEACCLGRTDAAGKLAYRGLPLSYAWARQAGRQPSVVTRWQTPPEASTRRDPLEVRLMLGAAGCTVAGTVVDPRGHPVAGARVFVACVDTLSTTHRELSLTADEQGRFRCDEVPPGDRFAVADAPGFAPAQTRFATTPAEPAGITLALREGATLSGRVSDSAGQPLAGITVTTRPARVLLGIGASWGASRGATTDAEGRYRIATILPGETEVDVAVKPPIVVEFDLADGEQRTFDAAQEPERCVSGVVVDAEEKPLAGWRVELTDAITSIEAFTRGGLRHDRDAITDDEGRFRIDALADRAYRLCVFRGGKAVSASQAAAMVPRAVREGLRPSSAQLTVRIDAAAMASGWIEGSIALPEGSKAEAVLMLYAKVLAGGGYTVPTERLAPGATMFRLGPLPAGEYDLLCDVESRGRMEQRGLRLAPGETLRLPPFAADAQQSVQFVLRHADGRPAVGGEVRLRPSRAVCTETAPGRYESPPLSPGPCEANVHGPDFAPCTFAFDAGPRGPIERTVPAGTQVHFALKPATPRDRWTGLMQVRIADAQGTEVVARMIQIDGKQDFVWPLGLLPGTYTVRMNEFRGGAVTTTIEVTSAPLRVDLQLAK